MAFPTVESITETAFSSAATAHDVDMPATVTADDLLLVFFANNNNTAVTTPSGWTLLQGGNQSFVNGNAYAKKADGTEGGGTVDFVTASSEAGTAQCYRITSWGGTLADDVDVNVIYTASSGTSHENPNTTTAGWGSDDNLFIGWIASGDDDVAVTGTPTNYTNMTDTPCGAGANLSGRIATCRRELASASDQMGAWTLASGEAAIVGLVVVEPGSAGGGPAGGSVPVFVHHLKQMAGN